MKKSFGLALGGGAALGIAHIGVLKYLEENKDKIEITHVAGTSAGSIAAAALALGIPIKEMENYVRALSWRKFTALQFPRRGLLSSDMLLKRLGELLGEHTFDDAKIPFSAVTTDIVNNERYVISEGKLLPAVAASCAIPGIFPPIRLNGRVLSDGGLMENVPIQATEELGADRVIAVDLNKNQLGDEVPGNLFEFLIRGINILLLRTHQYDENHHIIIAPNLRDFTALDIHRDEELKEAGYQAAQEVFEKLFREESEEEKNDEKRNDSVSNSNTA